MAFIVRTRSGQFSDEPHPEGLTHAVCVDVVDLGMQPSKFGDDVQKCKFVFETPARDSYDKPIRVSSWPYTVSLGKKANLRKDLERWRGKAFSDQELAGFDLESVIGAPAMLNIVHNPKGDRVYANIDTIMADRSKEKYSPLGTYVRAPKQEQHDEPAPEPEPESIPEWEEEVPF